MSSTAGALASDGQALVVGLGAVGAATLSQLAQRGARVAGIDRHSPPHALGSSHGESRITRLATGEGEAYVPLVQRSHTIWRQLEAASGQALYSACGGLVLAPPGQAGGPRGKSGKGDFLARTIGLAQRHGIAHEQLDATQIRQRHPALAVAPGTQGYFEPEAGFVRPEAAIAVQLAQARQQGAAVFDQETLLALEPHGQRLRAVTERAGQRRHHLADQVLLAAGPWLPGLLGTALPAAWGGQLVVHRQLMFWFSTGAAAADFRPARLPIFIWVHGSGDEDSFYGFPGDGVVKVATAQYRLQTTPDAVDRVVAPAEIEDFASRHLAGRLALPPGARCVDARACLYTVTPDRDFLVDQLPGLPGAWVASACSGHGFKHSAGLGEALAERLLGLAPTLDLSPFSGQRPALA